MAHNTISVDATPQTVFRVLSDPSTYPEWVVGAKRMRDADDSWPAAGSDLHHASGVGPAEVHDSTTVLEVEQDRRICLRARVRPFGVARVDITLEPNDSGGTDIVIDEWAEEAPGGELGKKAAEPLIFLRNVESTRRLKQLVEEAAAGSR